MAPKEIFVASGVDVDDRRSLPLRDGQELDVEIRAGQRVRSRPVPIGPS